MILKFEEWLVDQQYREDYVGDLARMPDMQGIGHTSSRHKTDEHKDWADIVSRMAQPGHIITFNEAWQEFLLAKQQTAQELPQ
jgi:hypothetical protein